MADATLVVSDDGDGVTMHGRLLLVDVACGIFVVSRKYHCPARPNLVELVKTLGDEVILHLALISPRASQTISTS